MYSMVEQNFNPLSKSKIAERKTGKAMRLLKQY